jgi:hypothetical protein
MEAALRTAYHTLNGKEHDPIEFKAVRGFEAVKEAEVDMGKAGKVKVAVTSGMANAKPLLDAVRAMALRLTPSSKSCAARVAASMAAVSRSSSRPSSPTAMSRSSTPIAKAGGHPLLDRREEERSPVAQQPRHHPSL